MKKIILVIILMFVSSEVYAQLNTRQTRVLRKTVNIHNRQHPGSDYFDAVTGGVYSTIIANKLGLTMAQVETAGGVLEGLGYIAMLTRDVSQVSKGLQAQQAGIDELAAIDAAQAQADADAAAIVAAQLASDIVALKLKLSLTDEEWDLITGGF